MLYTYPLLVALFWAVILTVIFAALAGSGTGGRHWPREDAGWGGVVLFFVVVWLATWGLGVWSRPVGPVYGGVPWLWFLFLAIVVALLMSASTPPRRRRLRAGNALVTAEQPTASADADADDAADDAAGVLFGLWFWFLIIVLIVMLVARYTYWRT